MVIIIKFFTNQGANHRIRKKVRKIMGVDISESLIYIGVHHCICTQSRLKSKKVQFCLKSNAKSLFRNRRVMLDEMT